MEENFKHGIARALDVRLASKRGPIKAHWNGVAARRTLRRLETLLGRYPANELMAIGQIITKEEVQAYNNRIDEEIAELRTELSARESDAIDKLRKAQLSKVPKDIRADMAEAIETPVGRRTEVHRYLLKKYEEMPALIWSGPKGVIRNCAAIGMICDGVSVEGGSKKPIPNGDMAISA